MSEQLKTPTTSEAIDKDFEKSALAYDLLLGEPQIRPAENLPLPEAQALRQQRIRAAMRELSQPADLEDICLSVNVDGLGEPEPERLIRIELHRMQKDQEVIKETDHYTLVELATPAQILKLIQQRKRVSEAKPAGRQQRAEPPVVTEDKQPRVRKSADQVVRKPKAFKETVGSQSVAQPPVVAEDKQPRVRKPKAFKETVESQSVAQPQEARPQTPEVDELDDLIVASINGYLGILFSDQVSSLVTNNYAGQLQTSRVKVRLPKLANQARIFKVAWRQYTSKRYAKLHNLVTQPTLIERTVVAVEQSSTVLTTEQIHSMVDCDGFGSIDLEDIYNELLILIDQGRIIALTSHQYCSISYALKQSESSQATKITRVFTALAQIEGIATIDQIKQATSDDPYDDDISRNTIIASLLSLIKKGKVFKYRVEEYCLQSYALQEGLVYQPNFTARLIAIIQQLTQPLAAHEIWTLSLQDGYDPISLKTTQGKLYILARDGVIFKDHSGLYSSLDYAKQTGLQAWRAAWYL